MQKITELKFSVLSKVKSKLLKKIKLVYIFGETGSEVIFIDIFDKVFSFGTNSNGVLGLGHKNPIEEPTIIEDLCDKQVVDIKSGCDYVLALTKSGHLYSWGNNSYGQLANGSQDANYNPILIKTLSENNIFISSISCGSYHSLILTNMGEIYGFGANHNGSLGCGHNEHQSTPIKIDSNFFNSEKVISIECGDSHSLALTESGHVFSWGYNKGGELGIRSGSNQNTPILIDSIQDIVIKKVSCGSNHSILLSNDGSIYTFGANSCGELGNGTTFNLNKPIILSTSVKFIDIASDFMSQISIGVSTNGKCYVWGDCVKEVGRYVAVETPKRTRLTSIYDIFAKYGKRKITYKAFVVENDIQTKPESELKTNRNRKKCPIQ